jgi:hypothetical protein
MLRVGAGIEFCTGEVVADNSESHRYAPSFRLRVLHGVHAVLLLCEHALLASQVHPRDRHNVAIIVMILAGASALEHGGCEEMHVG